MHLQDSERERLKARVKQWRAAFSDDTTGIERTLDDLLWSYACFRTVIKIVSLANQKRVPDRPPLNQMIFDLIADGYWSRLLLGLRRLLDPACIAGKKGVYSVRSVISDIKLCAPKITRRVYVELVWEAKYDLERMERDEYERLLEGAKTRTVVWGDPDLMRSRMAHDHFDVLSGTDRNARREGDLLAIAILDKAEARLAKLDHIKEHVSSHLAHAGNAESRDGKLLDQFDIRTARECLKELKQLADLIGMLFTKGGGAGLATFIGDQFAGLDEPLAGPDEIKELEKNWREIDRDIASWSISPSEL